MPKLSIITINFNDHSGLEKTIQSVLSQSYKDYEYIVIDGGSTDGSENVIRMYAGQIKYWVSEKDNGIYHAQNKGIRAATGDYCLFLNSGDHLVDTTILKSVFATGFSEDIVYGDMMIDTGDGKVHYGKHPDKVNFDFMIHTTLWHPVSLIKRSLFEKYGLYNEELKIISDYEFFLKTIVVHNVTTRHIPIAIAVFNTAGIGSSNKYKRLHNQERKLIQEKYFDKKMIAEAKTRVKKQRGTVALVSDWLDQYPTIKKAASFLYQGIKKGGGR